MKLPQILQIPQLDVRDRLPGALARASAAAEREGLVDVFWKPIESPAGRLLAAATPRGLVMLAFEEERPEPLLERLARRLSPRMLRRPGRLDPYHRQLDEYFLGRRRSFDAPLDWSLVERPFSRGVLEAARRVPFGATASYGDLASAAGSPRASRAAGSALGHNPLCVVVPCHRILPASGALGGYAYGPERKRWLLQHEGGQRL